MIELLADFVVSFYQSSMDVFWYWLSGVVESLFAVGFTA